MTIQFEEDVAGALADLLKEIADEHGAPNFAWHLAETGMTPANLRLFASRWERDEFDPPALADRMRELADQVQEQAGGYPAGAWPS
jgi:hypothetical protein